jgi:hypothetical protein
MWHDITIIWDSIVVTYNQKFETLSLGKLIYLLIEIIKDPLLPSKDIAFFFKSKKKDITLFFLFIQQIYIV